MKLVTALALVSLAVAAGGVVLSANLYGPDDPYFKWGVAMLAVPPAVVGLLLLAPWRPWRITAGWLALVLGFLWVVAGGSGLLGGIVALVGGSEQQDLAGTLVWGTAAGMIAVLNLAIFWAAEGGRTEGWVAAASRDGTPWIGVGGLDCPVDESPSLVHRTWSARQQPRLRALPRSRPLGGWPASGAAASGALQHLEPGRVPIPSRRARTRGPCPRPTRPRRATGKPARVRSVR